MCSLHASQDLSRWQTAISNQRLNTESDSPIFSSQGYLWRAYCPHKATQISLVLPSTMAWNRFMSSRQGPGLHRCFRLIPFYLEHDQPSPLCYAANRMIMLGLTRILLMATESLKTRACGWKEKPEWQGSLWIFWLPPSYRQLLSRGSTSSLPAALSHTFYNVMRNAGLRIRNMCPGHNDMMLSLF